MEPNPNAIKKASEKGIKLFSNFEEVKNKKFDIITLWHVLEHMPELDNQIKKIKDQETKRKTFWKWVAGITIPSVIAIVIALKNSA